MQVFIDLTVERRRCATLCVFKLDKINTHCCRGKTRSTCPHRRSRDLASITASIRQQNKKLPPAHIFISHQFVVRSSTSGKTRRQEDLSGPDIVDDNK